MGPMATASGEAGINGSFTTTYGSRLLPQVVDELATTNPGRVYATYQRSSDISEGFRDVTMGELASAVNKAAFWLMEVVGRSTTFETIAYVGPSDLRYAIMLLAAIKCGYKLLVPSPRNAPWMTVSLLRSTACTKFFYTLQLTNNLTGLWREKNDLKFFAVDTVDSMLKGTPEHFPYKVSYARAQWDPILVLHSSGSTGPPKPVVTNHASWAVADRDRHLSTVKGRDNQNWALFNFADSGGRYFSAFPPFHLGGIMAMVVLPIYSNTATVVLGPSDRPPTGSAASAVMQLYPLKAIFAPPSIFQQILDQPGGLEQAARLDFILYAGGPLTERTGDALSQVTNVCQFYGSTETNGVNALVPRREDWAYFEWHPSSGVEMVQSEDNAYELVLHTERGSPETRVVSCNFPRLSKYHTKDLFRPHPTKANLWRFHGRRDDILVLSNGEKFNPVPSENIIASHPLLSGALIVGQGRFQPALLVQPQPDVEIEVQTLTDEIWPTVQQANEQAPGHGRISRSLILVAGNNKPFERAGKGTVIRKMTAEKFASEIETLYASASPSVETSMRQDLADVGNISNLRDTVRSCVKQTFSPPQMADDHDLFVHGLDSLKSAEIIDSIRARLPFDGISYLEVRTLYDNPSINELSQAIYDHLNPQTTNTTNPSSSRSLNTNSLREEKISSLIFKHTASLLPTHHIVLIGSTGSFGTHLLSTLLRTESISHITCLNRSSDASDRTLSGLSTLSGSCPSSPSNNNSSSHDPSRLSFHTFTPGAPHLGLDDHIYKSLATNVDLIIHSAWPVDFALSLPSFEPSIRDVRSVIDLSISGGKRQTPRVVFVSSVSAVANYANVAATIDTADATMNGINGTTDGVHEENGGKEMDIGKEKEMEVKKEMKKRSEKRVVVPESHVESHAAPLHIGYAESKHVAECVLAFAARRCDVPFTILRVGQIAGAVDGANAASETTGSSQEKGTSKANDRVNGFVNDGEGTNKGVSNGWSEKEWFHALIKTGRTLNALPKRMGWWGCGGAAVDWLPVDTVAGVVKDVVMGHLHTGKNGGSGEEEGQPEVLNIVNPNPADVHWETLMRWVGKRLIGDEGGDVRLVELEEWIEMLEAAAAAGRVESGDQERGGTDKGHSDDVQAETDEVNGDQNHLECVDKPGEKLVNNDANHANGPTSSHPDPGINDTRTVPHSQQSHEHNIQNLSDLPALKILPFFHELSRIDQTSHKHGGDGEQSGRQHITFSTTKATAASETLRCMGPLREEWVRQWLGEWGF